MKDQKGITIVVLVITIVIMLILAGIAINTVIGGGLFDEAMGAEDEMQKEADSKALMTAALSSLKPNKKVDFNVLDNNLPDGFTKTGDRRYKSAKGNIFTVDLDGIVTFVEKGTIDFSWASVGLAGVETSATYKSSGGRLQFTNDGKIDFYYIDEETEIETLILEFDATKHVGDSPFTFTTEEKTSFYNTLLSVNGSNINSQEVQAFILSLINESAALEVSQNTGNISYLIGEYTESFFTKMTDALGKKVNYNNMDWYVLYDDSYHGVELVSAEAYGSVTLGSDPQTGSFEQALNSYNNAVATLTQACINATGISSNIRNIGGPAQDSQNAEYLLASEIPGYDVNNDTWFDITAIAGNEGIANGEIFNEDENQILNLGIFITDTPASYWISSIYHDWHDDDENGVQGVVFGLGRSDPSNNGSSFWPHLVKCYNDTIQNNYPHHQWSQIGPYAVRPVVKISHQLLEQLLQAQNN